MPFELQKIPAITLAMILIGHGKLSRRRTSPTSRPWKTVLAIWLAAVALLLVVGVVGVVGDGPLLTQTAIVSLPIALAVCLAGHVALRRRYSR